MRLRVHLLVAASLLFATAGAMAAESTVSQDMYTQNGFDGRIFDTSAPMATRMQLFSRIIELANQGQVPAQDLAGTLYWQGPATQGSPVPKDLKQARSLLGNAAIRGDRLAMAKLAELELQDGDKAAAMVWAQLYGHYLNPVTARAHQNTRRSAYAGDLLQRIIAAGGKVDSQTAAHVNAFVARYNQQIRDGMQAMRVASEHRDPRMITGPLIRLQGADNNLDGVAEYMFEFNPAGEPTHIWTLASYPDARIATATREGMDHIRANPVAAGSPMRYLRIPIPLNGGHKSVRISH